MVKTFPGTTIEVLKVEKGSSRHLFDGIFATGGITLSQVSLMTGLEPYIIQNWVKRGYVDSPKKRVYSRGQFARIVIINMLREALKLEDICSLIKVIEGDNPDTDDDDIILDDELYHSYVDMLAEGRIELSDREAATAAADAAAAKIEERRHGTRKTLSVILQIMLSAHAASMLRTHAENMLGAIK